MSPVKIFRLSLCFLTCLTWLPSLPAQKEDLMGAMYRQHSEIRQPGLDVRRFGPAVVHAALDTLGRHPDFRVGLAGRSVEGRAIPSVSWGDGPVRILLWSQMHGDEPTATMALLDLFNALQDERLLPQASRWKERLSLYILPLLNPDGAAAYTRHNALGIDLNRDALRRTSPEARLLWHWRDSLQPRWGFNLHDQHRYYSAGGTDLTAAMAFLAPPPDEQRSTPPHRLEAMQLIATLHRRLQKLIPGQVSRYHDAFEARAFGDQFTAAGTATVLIEAGWISGDEEKQTLRKLYFATLVAALEAISAQSYRQESQAAYQRIPFNQNRLFELLIRRATVHRNGMDYTLDIAYKREELPSPDGESWYALHKVTDLGDLDPFSAHQVLDARGLRVVPALTYGHVLPDRNLLRETPVQQLVRQGYAIFRIQGTPVRDKYLPLPIALRHPEDLASEPLLPGNQPVFYLEHPSGEKHFIVVNGRAWDLRGREWEEALLRFLAHGEE
jgi:hypothetical protein